ncbi:uncharacterized protein LACBIDRAFT_310878 [Laccaria bicolor S238N-H82]|uniref:Predicted protein n=1 Tax=Laccaria bicolor (strain S238N-H82 / ATCC MYA-4686) TaxID=486041 RepID=B0DVB0_LACBS|nr:uncharacterized protein LACBIDRAFT_310878 [Laccaria bicolor S238N-H82]EDR01481.1 predicted protein [Laccaria bicolor S238N-H82]|eukprot:XP_001887833.1 predicted protein [Laccaria bicolor S238N-H82]
MITRALPATLEMCRVLTSQGTVVLNLVVRTSGTEIRDKKSLEHPKVMDTHRNELLPVLCIWCLSPSTSCPLHNKNLILSGARSTGGTLHVESPSAAQHRYFAGRLDTAESSCAPLKGPSSPQLDSFIPRMQSMEIEPVPRPVVASPGQIAASTKRRTNTTSTPFACSVCSSNFTKKHNLQNHMNSHYGVKNHRCEGGCEATFSTKSSLHRHLKKTCKAKNTIL